MKQHLLSALTLALVASVAHAETASGAAAAATAKGAKVAVLSSGIATEFIEPSVRPQDDFFEYLNGKWRKNTEIPADNIEIARQNTEESKRRILSKALPADGGEATSYSLRNNARRYYHAGQAPPQNIFNPFAWNEFIKAWKRGDYKKK